MSAEELAGRLEEIRKPGIRADVTHLKKDMCAQFTDPHEWVREYLVNSYDAGATRCRIRMEAGEGEVTVFVEDDGHGMDRQGVVDFFTLYRSRKRGDPDKTIGQFGIGKLSVAAIPGQKKFVLRTSNGREYWIAEAGSLLSDDPINIYGIREAPPQGTTFEITFTSKEQPRKIMEKLVAILRKYTSYLPILTEVYLPGDSSAETGGEMVRIGMDWSVGSELFGRSFSIEVSGSSFEVILGIGQPAQEIYQNRVLVSDRYNLFSHGRKERIDFPDLRIRVNSQAFELPFGRHCLKNEDILSPLSDRIIRQVVPEYYDHLLELYSGNQDLYHNLLHHVENIALVLMMHFPDHGRRWCRFPMFSIFPGKRLSLVSLEELVTRAGKIYLEEGEKAGVDYSFFDAPVLLQNQPSKALDYLKRYFKGDLVNLSLNDVVMEIPAKHAVRLSPEQKRFQENLGFEEGMSDLKKKKLLSMMFDRDDNGSSPLNSFGNGGDYPEVQNASGAFRNLTWKVNYLVGRDGKTPCLTHRFIVDKNKVILNLHHPDVAALVRLSGKAPRLAAHWAVAMCLTEGNRLLPHLSSESRQDILLADAMLKVSANTEARIPVDEKEFRKMKKNMLNMLRDSGFDFGLN